MEPKEIFKALASGRVKRIVRNGEDVTGRINRVRYRVYECLFPPVSI